MEVDGSSVLDPMSPHTPGRPGSLPHGDVQTSRWAEFQVVCLKKKAMHGACWIFKLGMQQFRIFT